jgi:hypothetical protein
MYNPEKYLTPEILDKLLAEFNWPEKYCVDFDDNSTEGIEVKFPHSSILFIEGFESEIDVKFLNEQTNRDENQSSLSIGHALMVLEEEAKNRNDFVEPKLSNFFSPEASYEKVIHGVKNMCELIQAYLLPCMMGDFSWVEKYENTKNKNN